MFGAGGAQINHARPWQERTPRIAGLKPNDVFEQGKAKKTRKFAAIKRMLSPNDARLCVIALFYAVTP